MHNFIVTLTVIMIAIVSLTVSTNLSTLARSTQYLKEDVEVAVHDASLQVDEEKLADGEIVVDETKALEEFKKSFELNTGIEPENYEIVEFKIFDHSNSSFPVEYQSSEIDFKDTIIYPTVLAVVRTYTDKYFYTSDVKPVTRVASYSYKLKNKNPVYDSPVVDVEPNENGFYWALPYTTNITSPFTPYRVNPVTNEIEAHKGIDIAQAGVLDQPVVSMTNGVVTFAGYMGGYGNIVEIEHGNGLITRYAHLNSISVSNGQNVEGGQVLGKVGSTGRSTGAHLHFETIFNGKHVNPLSFY